MSKKDKINLQQIHEDVPADHYDRGISHNIFQKIWHWRRVSEVLKVIEPVDGSVLDIGCHSGYFTQKIIDRLKVKSVYGVDISSQAIEVAKGRIPYGIFIKADATKLPFDSNKFDTVFCLEMLEHVDYPEKVVSEMKRVLKRGGYAVLLVPSDNLLFKLIWFIWTLYYPVWRHAHVNSFSGNSLEKLLKQSGFKISSTKYFNINMLKLIVCHKGYVAKKKFEKN